LSFHGKNRRFTLPSSSKIVASFVFWVITGGIVVTGFCLGGVVCWVTTVGGLGGVLLRYKEREAKIITQVVLVVPQIV
jgi:hypothetical protein